MTTQLKALLATGAALLLALAACAVLAARLDAEQAAHQAAKRDYARDMATARANEATARDTIDGLRREVRDVAAAFADYRQQEHQRQAIMAGVKPRQRTPEERERIVDDETRRKAADFLNAW